MELNDILSLTPWTEEIKNAGAPVVLYGTGNGADRIIGYMASHGISPDCVAASEGFVRDRSFAGHKVVSLAEAERLCGKNMTVITAFALEGEKSGVFCSLASKYRVFCPNLPPFGSESCDIDYIRKNYSRFEKVYSLLGDDSSRQAFVSLLAYDVSAAPAYSSAAGFVPPYEYTNHGSVHIDVGAYNGDSAEAYAKAAGYSRIVALEPDASSFSALVRTTSEMRGITCVNAAASDTDGYEGFASKGSRASSLGSGSPVRTVKLDTLMDRSFLGRRAEWIGSIKIDAEGADMRVLEGAVNIVYEDAPCVCCAVYHRAGDLADIPLWLLSQHSGYRFYLERRQYIPAFDVFVYAVDAKK